MNGSIVSLPVHILSWVANYLLPVQEGNKRIFKFSTDWRNFMNTSQEYFGEWKKQCQLVVLQFAYAEKFRESESFRDRVLSVIRTPLEQLELHLISFFHTKNLDLTSFGQLKKIDVSRCQINNFPTALLEASFDHCTIASFNNFPPVRSFHLDNKCEIFIEDDNKHNDDLDVRCLKISEEASFIGVDLLSYHTLSHLKSISIAFTDSINDVSCFKSIRQLKFQSCPNITDVNSLQNAFRLELLFCQGITDVSSLGKVYHLSLSGCGNITDISALGNIHTLNLDRCSQITNVSSLTNVVELHLDGFRGSDLSGLKKVETLYLRDAPNVSDISTLRTIKSLYINPSTLITHFCGLNNLSSLNMGPYRNYVRGGQTGFPVAAGCEVFQRLTAFHAYNLIFLERASESFVPGDFLQLKHLANLRTLTLQKCLVSQLPEAFIHLQSLTIQNCQNFSCFPKLPSLGYLQLNRCPSLTDLSLCGGCGKYPVYNVNVSDCKGLKEIRVSRKVSKMEIYRCESLADLTVFSQINYLKIIHCPGIVIDSVAPIISQHIR
jgi:hypothetical protein